MSENQKKLAKHKYKFAILSRTKLYGFELFMSVIGLLATAFVVDYGIFSLFRHFSNDTSFYQGPDQIVIFLVAAAVVWLPVAVFFYLRARGEFSASPNESSVHRALVSIYMAINTVIAIGALFYAIYSLLELTIAPSSGDGDVVLRQIIPGLLMAVWHGSMLFAFTRRLNQDARIFSIYFGVVTVVIISGLFIVTAGNIRASALDEQKEYDLSVIQSQLAKHYYTEAELPRGLDGIDQSGLNNGINEYRYSKIDERRYEICAEFIQDTSAVSPDYGSSSARFTEYPLWGYHMSGDHCYKISLMPDDVKRDS